MPIKTGGDKSWRQTRKCRSTRETPADEALAAPLRPGSTHHVRRWHLSIKGRPLTARANVPRTQAEASVCQRKTRRSPNITYQQFDLWRH
jgi:hypothetical protein